MRHGLGFRLGLGLGLVWAYWLLRELSLGLGLVWAWACVLWMLRWVRMLGRFKDVWLGLVK